MSGRLTCESSRWGQRPHGALAASVRTDQSRLSAAAAQKKESGRILATTAYVRPTAASRALIAAAQRAMSHRLGSVPEKPWARPATRSSQLGMLSPCRESDALGGSASTCRWRRREAFES